MRTARVCAEGVPTPAIDAIVVPAALLGGMDVVHRPVKSGVPSGAILGSCWLRSVPCKRGRSNRVSDGKEPQVSPCQRKGSLELVCAQIRGFRGPVKPTATKGIALQSLIGPRPRAWVSRWSCRGTCRTSRRGWTCPCRGRASRGRRRVSRPARRERRPLLASR